MVVLSSIRCVSLCCQIDVDEIKGTAAENMQRNGAAALANLSRRMARFSNWIVPPPNADTEAEESSARADDSDPPSAPEQE